MIYKEVKQDLFSVSPDYYLVHCISADFKMGAGIAKVFNEMGTSECLYDVHEKGYPWNGEGTCVYTWAVNAKDRYKGVFHLITKEKYYQKPTYQTLKQALLKLKINISKNYFNSKKLAMPKIGCGWDKLQWDKVKEIIYDVFSDCDIEILVCYI